MDIAAASAFGNPNKAYKLTLGDTLRINTLTEANRLSDTFTTEKVQGDCGLSLMTFYTNKPGDFVLGKEIF